MSNFKSQHLGNVLAMINEFRAENDQVATKPKFEKESFRSLLNREFNFDKAKPLEELVAGVDQMMSSGTLHTIQPGYLGLFDPAPIDSSIVGDLMATLYNPQLSAWSHAPAANEIERHTTNYFLEAFGLSTEKGIGTFTTGGNEANLSAVLCALTDKFPEFAENGAYGLPGKPIIYLSSESHHSFNKTVHNAGVGRSSLCFIPSDSKYRLDVNVLKQKFQEHKAAGFCPFLVIATAGTTSGGVIDPLDEIALFAKENELWFHVDAAWGGAAVFSKKLKPYLQGIEKANSITFDAHKWLSVPRSAGVFLCDDKSVVEKTFEIDANYMPPRVEDTIDPYCHSIQWTRRFNGLKVFLSLNELGKEGIANMLNHQTEMGTLLKNNLSESGWEIVNDTPLPLVCFSHPKIECGEINISQILEKVEKENFWISKTTLKNRNVLRACITNFRTEKSHIESLSQLLDSLV